MITFAFLHGAGETSDAWKQVQALLTAPSVAVDLLGRGAHPSDLSQITLDHTGDQAARDIAETTAGDVILVAHSISGALTPHIAAQLGARVKRVVHLAAVCATPGEMPLAVASSSYVEALLTDDSALRTELSGTSFAPADAVLPSGLRPLADKVMVARLDSVNLGCVAATFDWKESGLPRTFIQTSRDRIYSQKGQRRVAEAFGADDVIEIDTGHNPARSAPEELAALLDGLVRLHD
jgi:pimeloyl-ACP methyl ester carboxylesterase